MAKASNSDLRWRIMAYVTDGTGSFFIAVAAILIAGIFFSKAFQKSERVRRTFQALVRHESEPYRGETFQVAAAAVLTHLEQETPLSRFISVAADSSCDSTTASTLEASLSKIQGAFQKVACKPGRFVAERGNLDVRDAETRCSMSSIREAAERVDWAALAERDGSVTKRYFISMHGLTYSTPRGLLRELPQHHPFHGASYVREVLKGKSSLTCIRRNGNQLNIYRTKPYIDITGDGLVQTYCSPVYMAADAKDMIVGAYCIDVGLPIDTIRDSVKSLDHVFDARSVILTAQGARKCNHDCKFRLDSALPKTLQEIQNYVKSSFDQHHSVFQQVDGFQGSSGYVLLVPARRLPKPVPQTFGQESEIEAIVLTPIDVNVIELAHLMLGLVLLIAAGAVVFLSSARQRERERLRILHGLPIPVVVTRGSRVPRHGPRRVRLVKWIARRLWLGPVTVEPASPTDRWDEILFANAAAESLLDRKLPRFPRAIRPPMLRRSIEAVATAYLHQWLQGEDRKRYAAESEGRAFGQESEYEVTLMIGRNKYTKIKIRGAWIRRANGDIDTFGVILPINNREASSCTSS
jgi:hypothetical protein